MMTGHDGLTAAKRISHEQHEQNVTIYESSLFTVPIPLARLRFSASRESGHLIEAVRNRVQPGHQATNRHGAVRSCGGYGVANYASQLPPLLRVLSE